jgi:predicted GNAT family acetyltransferase
VLNLIRKLTQEDHENCFAFVNQKPAENLFIIGDIEAYGYESDVQTLWGDFDGEGKLLAVLLKYRKNYLIYAPGEFDSEGFAALINEDDDFAFLSGIDSMVNVLGPHIKRKPKAQRNFYYAKCDSPNQLDLNFDLSPVQKAVPDDAERIIDQMNKIPEFIDSIMNVENKREGMKKGIARTFFIEEDAQIVSSASTTAENSLSAMIVGVATLEEAKRKGYASLCMTALCKDLLEEGKELCLFYDNPEAGSIYKRLGFRDIGMWSMWRYPNESVV